MNAVGLALVILAVDGGTLPAGWISRSVPASRAQEWGCANWSTPEWVVSAEGGRLAITQRDLRAPAAKLPFPIPDEQAHALKGPSAVRAVSGGYLVGFDRGEFGGGLYWFSRDGKERLEISPPAPRSKESARFPENVHAIVEHEGIFYVFQGLAHLGSRDGRVLQVTRDPRDRWQAKVLVALPSTPAAITVEQPGSWLVATSDGILRLRADGGVERIWKNGNLSALYPGSIARTAEGSIHVGMRAWVLRVVPGPNGWKADLLAPASCARFRPEPPKPGMLTSGCTCAGSPR